MTRSNDIHAGLTRWIHTLAEAISHMESIKNPSNLEEGYLTGLQRSSQILFKLSESDHLSGDHLEFALDDLAYYASRNLHPAEVHRVGRDFSAGFDSAVRLYLGVLNAL